MIDHRSSQQLESLRYGKPSKTFKEDLDFWNIKPRLVNYKEVPPNRKDVKEFRTSVHHLKQWNQIMHIVPDVSDPTKIFFLFF